MHHQSIDCRLESDYFLLPNLVPSLSFITDKDTFEDVRILFKDILIQNCDQTNTLNRQQREFLVQAFDRWVNQTFTNLNDVLVLNIPDTTLL